MWLSFTSNFSDFFIDFFIWINVLKLIYSFVAVFDRFENHLIEIPFEFIYLLDCLFAFMNANGM